MRVVLGPRIAPRSSAAWGLARSLLALATALTLTANSAADLAGGRAAAEARCEVLGLSSALCALGGSRVDASRLVCVLLLLLVAVGWRPRWTAPAHFWISLSVVSTFPTSADGGDYLVTLLAAWSIPIALTDSRRWHWSPPVGPLPTHLAWLRLGASAQVAAVYAGSVVAKLASRLWRDGSALSAYVADPVFGATTWGRRLAEPVLSAAPLARVLGWTTLVIEAAVVGMVVISRRSYRQSVTAAAVALHAAIAVVFGLISFGLVMTAALVLVCSGPRIVRLREVGESAVGGATDDD